MAISKGFPPFGTVSPSVRITENDQSFVTPDQSSHRGGIVGFASKGPMNIPTLVTSRRDLNNIFGFPHPESGDPYMIYAGEQYLSVANELYCVRVGVTDNVNDERAVYAEVDTPSSGGQIVITSDTPGDYSFSTDSFFRWRLNGVLSARSLIVPSDANRESPDTGDPYTCAALASYLNEQVDSSIDGIEFFCTTDERIGVRTTFAYGPDSTLELVSVQDSIYGGDTVGGGGTNVTGWGQSMTQGETTGETDRYPDNGYQVSGDWDFTALTGLNLQVVIDGTDNTLIDNVVQVIDLSDLEGLVNSTADIVTEINAQITAGTIPGGFEADATGDNLTLRTLHYGRDARLLVKSSSTTNTIFGFDNLTASGTSPAGVSGDGAIQTFGIVSGDTNTTGEVTFTITADSAGIDGNATQVVITNDTRSGTFQMDVYNNGVQVESWGQLTKDTTSRLWVESYIDTVSNWIRVIDNTDNPAPPLNGTYDLVGGTDGIPADPDEQDALLIGNRVGSTGLYALSQPDQIDIDILCVPGHSSTSVALALIDICENERGDCMALIDPPFGLTVNEIVAWQNGTHPLNSTRFDSDFAALYWPWVKLRDTTNRIDVWCPPSGSIMAVYARNDILAQPWYAPAGETRGIVPNITDVFTRPTADEADLMYGNRNCVNPILSFANLDGFVVWGQKTLQRLPSALDRVNVRRLMFYVEKRIKAAVRVLLFDPNDDEFRDNFLRIVNGILEEVRVLRGIDAFIVNAGDDLNTPDVKDRNGFRANIGIVPTRAVEYIYIQFSLHRTGAFTENTDTI